MPNGVWLLQRQRTNISFLLSFVAANNMPGASISFLLPFSLLTHSNISCHNSKSDTEVTVAASQMFRNRIKNLAYVRYEFGSDRDERIWMALRCGGGICKFFFCSLFLLLIDSSVKITGVKTGVLITMKYIINGCGYHFVILLPKPVK